MRSCAGLVVLAATSAAMGQSGMIKDITWRLGAPFPELRKGCSLGVFEGKAISAGGMRHPWCESTTTYQYDAQADKWIALPNLPRGRVYMDGVSLPDAFYVVGGRREGRTLAELTQLSRKGGRLRWVDLNPMSADRGWAAMDVWQTRIIVAGGNSLRKGQPAFNEKSTCKTVEVFDTARPEAGWSKLPDIPGHGRGWVAGAVVGDAFYLFGGLHFTIVDGKRQNHRLRETLRLDLKTRQWSRRADLPYALSGHDAVSYGDRYVILAGGAPDWSADQDKAYGRVPNEYSNRVLVYDTKRDAYRMLPSPMPHGTNDIRVARIGQTVYALGGENVEKATSNTTNFLRIGTIVTAGE